jgi:hypothetical protein
MPYDQAGAPHASFGRAKFRDSLGSKAPKPSPVKEEAAEGAEKENSPEDIASVVAEQGPAHEMHYHHDAETNKHHVTSHHGEGGGHHHHSTHGSAHEAHAHMHKAMGLGDEKPEHEEPDGDEAMAPAGASASIPGM